MELIGWIASFILILSYYLLSIDKIKSDEYTYHMLNLIGSVMFIIYSVHIGANSSIFINTIFSIIAFYTIIKICLKQYSQRGKI